MDRAAPVGATVDSRARLAGELIEAAAYESFAAVAPAELANGGTAYSARFGNVVARVVEPLPEVALLNGLMGAGAGTDDADELTLVDQALAWLRERNIGGYASVAPGSFIERTLREDRGFEPGYAWMKFRRDLTATIELAETPLQLREVGVAAARDFGETVTEGFSMPPFCADWFALLVGAPGWHCVVAYEDDQPAGCGSLFVSGDVAWLGTGATRPDFRRRGAQSALLTRRLELAREFGCTVAYTETGERMVDRPSDSYRNILRAGFVEDYLRPNLVIPLASAD